MISCDITKIEMYDEDEFTLYFSVECDDCKIASGQHIKGKFMTKMKVSCSTCHKYLGVDIIPEIERTLRDKWNYDEDTIDEVMKKVWENFAKS
jgi:hypothetical protein